MSVFNYQVKDSLGKTIRGEMTADSVDQLYAQLSQDGYTVVDIRAKEEAGYWTGLLAGFGRVSLGDLVGLTRQLHTLIKAGIPLFESLGIMLRQQDKKRLIAILESIRSDCAEGEALSVAMAKHPKVFDNLYIAMVKVGETGGNLEGSLERIQKFLEEEMDLRSNILQAITYPAILVTMAVGIVILFAVWVIPKFALVFTEAKIPLPLPTQIVVGFSNILLRGWWAILAVLALLVFGYVAFAKTKFGRGFLDRFKLQLPLVGTLILKLTIAKMTRTLGVLDSSGVPLLQSLQITQGVVGNVLISNTIDELVDSVREGRGLAEPMRRTGLYPIMVVQMVATGEESGYLDKMLVEVAEYYEKESAAAIKRLVVFIEPAMLVAMGCLLLIIALSIFLPLFKMGSAIRGQMPQ